TTVVTWTYDDTNGNTATQTQNIVVTGIDTTVGLSGNVLTSNSNVGNTFQWVDCDNGFQPIMGETAQSFTATTNGSYAALITSGACSDTSVCSTISGIGWTELDEEAF